MGRIVLTIRRIAANAALVYATLLALFSAMAVLTSCAGEATTGLRGGPAATARDDDTLDRQLTAVLKQHGFTGRVESSLEKRLGRPIDRRRAELGRLLFFDSILSIYQDNACAACHSPTTAMSDTQSIAIGVDNNGVVGPGRRGPRNQRRALSVINSAFFPRLMHNARFVARSGDPFDHSKGFEFPAPEGTGRFPPRDPETAHLLVAQAHLPPTELPEMAGFRNIAGTLASSSRFQVPADDHHLRIKVFPEWDVSVATRAATIPAATVPAAIVPAADAEPDFIQFDDGKGLQLPPPDATDSRNEPIRVAVVGLLNASPAYRQLFAAAFEPVARGGPITFAMVGQAIAEFEFTLTFADAPIDHFARGQRGAMSDGQKCGGLLFFGKARCVECHAVSGNSNEMFSDFDLHTIGVPQIAPRFGRGLGNVPFRDARGKLVVRGNEDWGRFDVTAEPADRYKFRTPPLRNVALQPAFFHNGSFTRLEDAIRHHLDPARSGRAYDPREADVADDLCHNLGPIEPVLQRLDPLLSEPVELSEQEFANLVEFVRAGLTDERAKPEHLRKLIPTTLPSGRPLPKFE
jgi:cytochrome c peroxidase